jgi:hypothetical protein
VANGLTYSVQALAYAVAVAGPNLGRYVFYEPVKLFLENENVVRFFQAITLLVRVGACLLAFKACLLAFKVIRIIFNWHSYRVPFGFSGRRFIIPLGIFIIGVSVVGFIYYLTGVTGKVDDDNELSIYY